MRWPKYWSFSFSIIPSKDIPGLISFRMDWLDLLAVQRTLQESSPAPQFEGINSLVLSLLCGPTLTSINDYWKNHSCDLYWSLSAKWYLCFLIFCIDLLQLSCQGATVLISWLQSPTAVLLEPKKIVCQCFHFPPIYLPWSVGTGCHDINFLNVEFYSTFFTLLFHFHQKTL